MESEYCTLLYSFEFEIDADFASWFHRHVSYDFFPHCTCRVQEGHCLQLLGRDSEALAIYNMVLKTRPEDPALLSIINNNLVAINQGANVFDSRKRMKVAMAYGLEHKLTTRQRGTIALNHVLLAYHTNQVNSSVHVDKVCMRGE